MMLLIILGSANILMERSLLLFSSVQYLVVSLSFLMKICIFGELFWHYLILGRLHHEVTRPSKAETVIMSLTAIGREEVRVEQFHLVL
jgi:hypothetical protein